MLTCLLCGCEVDGTSGTVVHLLTVPVARCHGCESELQRELIRWLRSLPVERGMKRGDPGKALIAVAPVADFGPVS